MNEPISEFELTNAMGKWLSGEEYNAIVSCLNQYKLMYNNLKQAIELEENCIRKALDVLGETEDVSIVELALMAREEIKRLREMG